MTAPAESSTDRTATILNLLDDLGLRLRQSDGTQAQIMTEQQELRALFTETTARMGLAERLHEVFDTRLESHEKTVETVIRRLTSLEDGVERQTTSLLAILRKLEERFDEYDLSRRGADQHTMETATLLGNLDDKIERLSQDKTRLTRKLDALEEALARTQEHLRTASVAPQPDDGAAPKTKPQPDRPGLQVWTAQTAQPQFMRGPNDLAMPQPPVRWLERETVRKTGRLGALALVVLALSGGVYGIVGSLMQYPGDEPAGTLVTFESPEVETVAEQETEKTAGSDAPELFSKAIADRIAARMKEARGQEQKDTHALIMQTEKRLATEKFNPDPSLPRPIVAIEAKADEGSAPAQHDLAAMYTSGQAGVGVDYGRAAGWFQRAALAGVANARYNLGVLYQQGLGVEKDVPQALRWYRAASLMDHPEARYNLGIAYVEGIGTDYDPVLAAGYFEEAAKGGVVEAAYNLGLLLQNGLLEESRPSEALFWYTLAAAGGEKQANKARTSLMADMKLSGAQAEALIEKMKAERPDIVRSLTSKKTARSVVGTPEPQAIRIHTLPGRTVAAAQNPQREDTGKTPAESLFDGVADTLPIPETKTAPRKEPPVPPVQIIPAEIKEEKTTADTKIKPAETSVASSSGTGSGAPDGDLVKNLQTRLAGMGFFPGTPTGAMDPVTINAIRRYQMANSLTVDGQPSTGLLAHMLASQLDKTAQPAAGGGPAGAPAETIPEKTKTNPFSQKHIKVNE